MDTNKIKEDMKLIFYMFLPVIILIIFMFLGLRTDDFLFQIMVGIFILSFIYGMYKISKVEVSDPQTDFLRDTLKYSPNRIKKIKRVSWINSIVFTLLVIIVAIIGVHYKLNEYYILFIGLLIFVLIGILTLKFRVLEE